MSVRAARKRWERRSVQVAAPGGSGNFFNIFSTTPPKRQTLFYDNFESGGSKWVTQGIWQPWGISYDNFWGSNVITDSFGYYFENENSYVQTKYPIDATNCRGVHLSFKYRHALENGYDFLILEGSLDGINFLSGREFTGIGISEYSEWISADIGFAPFYLRFRIFTNFMNNYDGVYIDDVEVPGVPWQFLGNEYDYKSGTSMAAPVVSGVAGLIWSHYPHLTHLEVKNAILNSVDKLNSLNRKVSTGGRVNAYKALTAAAGQSLFGDVPLGYWAYDYITGIYNTGITTGCSQSPLMYCPDISVTREQMAVFITRALNQMPADGYCGDISPFSDVGFDRWSCKYIKRFAELGITTGYGDGRFGPGDSVTREQMAVFITKALAAVPPDGYCGLTNPFTDVSFDRWSCKYVKKFAELGITTGYGDGRFGPGDYVTRAQMAVFLSRAFLGM